MFRRRTKFHPLRRLREFIWPRIGWRRSTTYIAHRVGRLPGSPYHIAVGFACGAAMSFTPFMGFHFAGGALLAWLLRGSILASAIGTAVGNPWTFPLIWVSTYRLGTWILGQNPENLPPEALTLTYIFDHPFQVFLPMTVGGIVEAVIAWFAFYFPVRSMVATYQSERLRRRLKKAHDKKQELKI